MPPIRHLLLGMNAHINFDLPQALLAVINDAEFDDPSVIERRATDHAHIDAILASRVPEEDRLLQASEQPGDRTLDRSVDDAVQPPRDDAVPQGIPRAKVWRTRARCRSPAGTARRPCERGSSSWASSRPVGSPTSAGPAT